jgi:Lon protease-like protein
MATDTAGTPVPLFPLNTVLFPGGLLTLKIFEARYLDMVSDCLRQGTPFGVVALTKGHEVRQAGHTEQFEAVGCLAEVMECDSSTANILHLRCRGTRRFRREGTAQQAAGGLWRSAIVPLDEEPTVAPAPEHAGTVAALSRAIDALAGQGATPFLPPTRLDDAAWVANRWCELLPIPPAARQSLMELDDPLARLELVRRFLLQHQVIDA